MLLADLVETSRRTGASSKRLEKIEHLASFLRQLSPADVDVAVAFLSGQTLQGKIGAGLRKLHAAKGDPSPAAILSLIDTNRSLAEIAAIKGSGSETARTAALQRLFSRATGPEQDFLVRLIAGELRQGAVEGLMIEAVASASRCDPALLRRAAMHAGGIVPIAGAAMEGGPAALSKFSVQLFQPIQPMLAQTAQDASAALHELGEAALEFKIDGARIQAHKSGGDVRIFTRSLNEVTAALPEIVEEVQAFPARGLIVEGEAISLRPDGFPQPFQITMRRFGRKLDVEAARVELPIRPYWFDLLYLDDSSLLDEPQRRRFKFLSDLAPGSSLIPNLVTADAELAESFMRSSLEQGHEGLMAKSRETPYSAGARGHDWLKVKQARTLDLAILAAEWGNGRRQGWLSNLHLGARDAEGGGYAMLGKTFKGLTDAMLEWQTEQLLKLEIARDNYTVYVEPKLIAEIAFNEIQVSPRYASGLALRFARVKRYRTDKTAAECDTFQTVKQMAGI